MIGADVRVYRNDAITVAEADELLPLIPRLSSVIVARQIW